MPHKTTTQPPSPKTDPKQQDLQTAYEVHTLAQMLYGRLYGYQRPWPGRDAVANPLDPRVAPNPVEQAAQFGAVPGFIGVPQFGVVPQVATTSPFAAMQPFGMAPGHPLGWYR